MPSFGAEAPFSYYQMPAADRARRCSLGSDDCVIDECQFFVRGCLEIPDMATKSRFLGAYGSR